MDMDMDITEDEYHKNRNNERYVSIVEIKKELVRKKYASRRTLNRNIEKAWSKCGITDGTINHIFFEQGHHMDLEKCINDALEYDCCVLYKGKNIYLIFNHCKIGGALGTAIFTYYISGMFNHIGIQTPGIIGSIISSGYGLINIWDVPIVKKLIETNNTTRNYNKNNTLVRFKQKISIPHNEHPNFAMFRILSMISPAISNDKLNVVSAIPFEMEPHISNNIGIINYEFDYTTCTPEKFRENIRSNKWQAIFSKTITNYSTVLPRWVPNATSVRQSVDVLFSFITLNYKHDMEDLSYFSWSKSKLNSTYRVFVTGIYDKFYDDLYIFVEVLDDNVDISKLEASGFCKESYII